MVLGIIFCVVGLAILAYGSEKLVVNSSKLADHYHISPVIIGAVVIGMGTSAPEIAVSSLAAIGGDVDLGVGNVVGSNTANVTLVLGLAVIIAPMPVDRLLLYREFPICLLSVGLFALLVQNGITRIEGIILLALLAVALVGLVMVIKASTDKSKKNSSSSSSSSSSPTPCSDPVPIEKPRPPTTAAGFDENIKEGPGDTVSKELLWIILGLCGTVAGAQLMVTGAQRIADELGLASGFIGLTVVAVGTSLPELVTAILASRKGLNGILLGNVLGSNIFNSLCVGGLVGVIGNSKLDDSAITGPATYFMLGTMVWLLISSITNKKIDRWESVILVGMWGASLPLVL